MQNLVLIFSMLSITILSVQLLLRYIFKKEISFMKHSVIKMIDLKAVGNKRLLTIGDIGFIMLKAEINAFIFTEWKEVIKLITITLLISLTLSEFIHINRKHNQKMFMWIAFFSTLFLVGLLLMVVISIIEVMS